MRLVKKNPLAYELVGAKMAFIRIPGVVGKVYVPDEDGPKKHNCKDCFFCQWCSDDRCRACLARKAKNPKRACCKKVKKAKKAKK